MCTLRQSSGSQPALKTQLSGGHGLQQWPHGLEGGISVIAWGLQGYRLLVAESGSVAQVWLPPLPHTFTFPMCCHCDAEGVEDRHPVDT